MAGRRSDGAAPVLANYLARLQEVWNSIKPREITSRWYLPLGATGVSATAASFSTGKIALVPVFLARPGTLSSVAFRTTSVLSLTNAQVMVYAHDAATGRPLGAPLATSPSTAVSTTAGIVTCSFSTPLSLAAGWYWIGVTAQAAITCQCFDTTSNDYATTIGCQSAASAIGTAGTVNSITAPNTFGTALTISSSTTLTEVTTPATPALTYQLSTAASS